MKLTKRQETIVDLIKQNQPIRSIDIAKEVGVSQATVRSDLSILTSVGLVDGKPNSGYILNTNSDGIFKKEMERFIVKDIMREGITVNENESVYDASIKMILKDVSSLYVNDGDGYLVGVLSRKDLLKSAIHGSDTNRTPVALAMTRQPLYKVTEDDTLEVASKLIVGKEIDGLPVIKEENGKDKLIGRITKTNISEIFVKMIEDRR